MEDSLWCDCPELRRKRIPGTGRSDHERTIGSAGSRSRYDKISGLLSVIVHQCKHCTDAPDMPGLNRTWRRTSAHTVYTRFVSPLAANVGFVRGACPCHSSHFADRLIFPGSAEALVRWGEKIKYLLIAYLLSNICAKNYQNRFTYVGVIGFRWTMSKSFYRSANVIFQKLGRVANEDVVLQLLSSKCLPSLWSPYGN